MTGGIWHISQHGITPVGDGGTSERAIGAVRENERKHYQLVCEVCVRVSKLHPHPASTRISTLAGVKRFSSVRSFCSSGKSRAQPTGGLKPGEAGLQGPPLLSSLLFLSHRGGGCWGIHKLQLKGPPQTITHTLKIYHAYHSNPANFKTRTKKVNKCVEYRRIFQPEKNLKKEPQSM